MKRTKTYLLIVTESDGTIDSLIISYCSYSKHNKHNICDYITLHKAK